MDIQGVDLNLLGPLAVLLQERHVSRAAERANMSQPAMSRSLRSLRGVFGDELLVRGPGGYRLTPRAERLQRELADILPRLESLFSDQSFDPQFAAHAFRLAGTDYMLSLLGPPLLRAVLARSPASSLRFDGWDEGVYHDVERGALDVAFTGGVARPPLRSERLFEDHYVCVLGRDHPLTRSDQPPLEDYLESNHVIVNVAEARQGADDIRLEAQGQPRRANATVPYHALAVAAVHGTGLVATLPRRFAEGLSIGPPLRIINAPVEIGPVSFAMAWHPRLDNDPAQRWLRDMIRAVALPGQ